ncbi:MAG: hypothetical protein PHO62_07635 [Sulfurimonas sp.]|uniref:hypothetical protein n=1 Tax=Sulfurimonas sp. TaxID=2022749 RepID=UPI002603C690|nr:hypothetical protein [Sulfurimonas sp.]MDD5373277.1 hypothetical protein [Sulfurimonas sp.]
MIKILKIALGLIVIFLVNGCGNIGVEMEENITQFVTISSWAVIVLFGFGFTLWLLSFFEKIEISKQLLGVVYNMLWIPLFLFISSLAGLYEGSDGLFNGIENVPYSANTFLLFALSGFFWLILFVVIILTIFSVVKYLYDNIKVMK